MDTSFRNIYRILAIIASFGLLLMIAVAVKQQLIWIGTAMFLAIALNPENTVALTELSRSFFADGRYAQAAQYAAELAVLRQIVPATNEVPALLENVSTAARRVGLDLSTVEPMPVLVGEQFDTYRYKLSVTGGYHAIAAFLTNVGSLNRIIAPVALTLKPLSPQDQKKIRIQKKDESLLDSDFQIQTYIAHTPADPADATVEEDKKQ